MGKAVLDVSMSLDGFITGPHVSHELPLGQGGEQLHDWTRDAKEEMMQGGTAATIGAIVTGRRTYDLVDGWGGRGHRIAGVPVFVLTHRVPATVPQGPTPFIFITEGMVSAIEQAKKAAGDKQVYVMGSASLARQCLQAGLLDEILLHLVPLLLGQGIRLFDHIGITPIQLESVQVIEEAAVTHLRYRVVK
jgi:dihydrofolate reductase